MGIYSVFVFKFVCSSCLFFLFVFRRGFDLIHRNYIINGVVGELSHTLSSFLSAYFFFAFLIHLQACLSTKHQIWTSACQGGCTTNVCSVSHS